jgi:predicted RNase H-like nuclease
VLERVEALADVVPLMRQQATVCIDMPIGLSVTGVRQCDAAARRLLGPRRSSVFPAPPRMALVDRPYAELNTASKRRFDRGLSKQTFHLLPKIRETEALLRGGLCRAQEWLETHPELCFTALNDGTPMQHNKKTDAGFRERISVLERSLQYPIHSLINQTLKRTLRSQVLRDDLVDAMVCGVVACLPTDRRMSVPVDEVEIDQVGLRMAITCPALPASS